MGLFRRRTSSNSGAAAGIQEFWDWWPREREQVESATDRDELDTVAEELTARVKRIHPDLRWRIDADCPGERVLIVTGNGSEELRVLAERWLRAAPEQPGWEFRACLPPEPEALEGTFVLDDHQLDMEHVSLGLRVDARRARVDVTVYHPDFLFLPEDARDTVAQRALLCSLGEDDVMRWIGEVTTVVDKPVDALPVGSLHTVVSQVTEVHGGASWLSGQGRTAHGRPALVRLRFPLRRVDFPLCDLHVVLSVPYVHANPDRLPVDPSAAALRRLGNSLDDLGDRGVLAAYETGDDHRVFHLYVDPDSSVIAEIDQLAAGWCEGKARVSTRSDPTWRALRPYQG